MICKKFLTHGLYPLIGNTTRDSSNPNPNRTLGVVHDGPLVAFSSEMQGIAADTNQWLFLVPLKGGIGGT